MKARFIILFLLFVAPAYANQQVLVLSGGDNPGLNHYTQYLQTKTLYEHLLTRFSPQTVSLYFGGGNNLNNQPIPFDVHKLINANEMKQDVMFTGVIKNNQQANKQNINTFFYPLAFNK